MKDWQLYITQAQNGDRMAFDKIVESFKDMAVGYAYSVLGDFHLAEDAAQDAFIEAYFGISNLREPIAFPAWFRRVIYKYCDRRIRKKQLPAIPLEYAVDAASTTGSPFEEVSRQEMRDSVMEAVGSLSEKERTAIMLVYMGESSLAGVGEFLGIPVSTVKSRLYSARQHLKRRMAELVKDTLGNYAPGDDFGERVSCVLDGIEKIHWNTSALCFVGSTVACMHYIGEDVNNDYVMGISGGAFKLFWYPKWSPANCDLLLYGEEPVRRTFAALGYDYTYISDRDRKNPLHPKSYYQDLFVKSIDNGHPVIGIGIVGPPECCVVAGYDRGGEILFGRSYFQDNPFGGDNYQQESAGYFRTDDWYDNLYGCILIGDKKDKSSDFKIMRQTLKWAIQLARVPEFESPGFAVSSGSLSEGSPGFVECCGRLVSETHLSGLAAYDGIIEALGRDEDYPKDNIDILSFRCMALNCDGIGLLMHKRRSAHQFLRSMVDKDVPAAGTLHKAAEFYEKEAALIGDNMHLLRSWNCSKEEIQQITDPALRKQIADAMIEAKSLELKAVRLLEDAYSQHYK